MAHNTRSATSARSPRQLGIPGSGMAWRCRRDRNLGGAAFGTEIRVNAKGAHCSSRVAGSRAVLDSGEDVRSPVFVTLPAPSHRRFSTNVGSNTTCRRLRSRHRDGKTLNCVVKINLVTRRGFPTSIADPAPTAGHHTARRWRRRGVTWSRRSRMHRKRPARVRPFSERVIPSHLRRAAWCPRAPTSMFLFTPVGAGPRGADRRRTRRSWRPAPNLLSTLTTIFRRTSRPSFSRYAIGLGDGARIRLLGANHLPRQSLAEQLFHIGPARRRGTPTTAPDRWPFVLAISSTHAPARGVRHPRLAGGQCGDQDTLAVRAVAAGSPGSVPFRGEPRRAGSRRVALPVEPRSNLRSAGPSARPGTSVSGWRPRCSRSSPYVPVHLVTPGDD